MPVPLGNCAGFVRMLWSRAFSCHLGAPGPHAVRSCAHPSAKPTIPSGDHPLSLPPPPAPPLHPTKGSPNRPPPIVPRGWVDDPKPRARLLPPLLARRGGGPIVLARALRRRRRAARLGAPNLLRVVRMLGAAPEAHDVVAMAGALLALLDMTADAAGAGTTGAPPSFWVVGGGVRRSQTTPQPGKVASST